MDLSPFIGFGPSPLAQTWHLDIVCHLQNYSCVKSILVGQGGEHGLMKGFLFPIICYIKFKDFVQILKKSLLELHKILHA